MLRRQFVWPAGAPGRPLLVLPAAGAVSIQRGPATPVSPKPSRISTHSLAGLFGRNGIFTFGTADLGRDVVTGTLCAPAEVSDDSWAGTFLISAKKNPTMRGGAADGGEFGAPLGANQGALHRFILSRLAYSAFGDPPQLFGFSALQQTDLWRYYALVTSRRRLRKDPAG